MAITGITMAVTRNITRTKLGFAALGLLCLVMGAGRIIAFVDGGVPPRALDQQAARLMQAADYAANFDERLGMLRQAREAQEASLLQAPANTVGWHRLASLRLMTQNYREGALAAMQMSAHVAPYEPRLMFARAMSLYNLRDLPGNDDELLADTWRGAFYSEPNKVMDVLKTNASLRGEMAYYVQSDEFLAKRWLKKTREYKLPAN